MTQRLAIKVAGRQRGVRLGRPGDAGAAPGRGVGAGAHSPFALNVLQAGFAQISMPMDGL